MHRNVDEFINKYLERSVLLFCAVWLNNYADMLLEKKLNIFYLIILKKHLS